MADGAGVVEAVGEGVTEFKAGDHVVSTFFPTWLDGQPTEGDFSTVPGDGVDGYACEVVVRPTSWFTHAPKGYSHAEGSTLTTAGLTAWRALIGDGLLKPGDTVLVLGTGGVAIFALQIGRDRTIDRRRGREVGGISIMVISPLPSWLHAFWPSLPLSPLGARPRDVPQRPDGALLGLRLLARAPQAGGSQLPARAGRSCFLRPSFDLRLEFIAHANADKRRGTRSRSPASGFTIIFN